MLLNSFPSDFRRSTIVMELDKVIKAIIRDMNANRPVDQIARRSKVEKEFVEDVLQIYTTHPGIDMDGILDRLKFYS